MRRRRARPLIAVAAALLAPACGTGGTAAPAATTSTSTSAAAPAPTDAPAPTPTSPPPPTITVAAAGDIACEPDRAVTPQQCQMAATAGVVEAARPDLVLTLGDNQYENGAQDKFARSYAASWGRFKAVTRPSPGNHEYAGGRASGYFAYFGAAAGPDGRGWYSFDAGGWHFVALNSNCALVGCNPGTPQNEWLRADLAASHAACTLAYWHHSRFSSGFHGDTAAVAPLWDVLQAAGADLVLSGHDHHYERFAPLSPAGTPDPGGIREFVVGTGGRSLYTTFLPRDGSQVRRSTSFGVLVLTLDPGGYRWRFSAVPGDGFSDAGEGRCH